MLVKLSITANVYGAKCKLTDTLWLWETIMSVSHVNDLKQILFDEFGGFADKRIKNLNRGTYFIIDDRQAKEIDARGNLFPWFCQIGLYVIDKDKVRLALRGGVPMSGRVKKWAIKMSSSSEDNGLEVLISAGQQNEITELASAIREITKHGARYFIPSYKHVCPRAAKSLDKLAKVLDSAWKTSN